jgi:cysteine-rich repeat protein
VVLALFFAGGLTSCLAPSSVICDDGSTICASFQVCAPSGGGCLFPEQLTVCDGHVDGDTCTSPAGPGRCENNVCSTGTCGNGIKEVGEVCDDGNLMSGDGCSGSCLSDESCGNGIVELDEECDCGPDGFEAAARCQHTNNGGSVCADDCTLRYCGDSVVSGNEACDDGNLTAGDGCSIQCLSDEKCGNGYLDLITGEQCDDGNKRRQDGCTLGCTPEAYDWTIDDVDTSTSSQVKESGRSGAAAAYDEARGRLVLFGGPASFPEAMTPASESPPATLERVGQVFYGRRPRTEPPTRIDSAMVYDSVRERVGLFGGQDAVGGLHGDTWFYDGVDWHDATNAMAMQPDARSGHALAYDSLHGKLVLFGGTNKTVLLNDTWELFDGMTSWTKSTNTTPLALQVRIGAAAAFDADHGVTVLFGGAKTTTHFNDTWTYGTAWTRAIPTTTSPSTREFAAMAWQPEWHRIVLFGGERAGTPFADAFTWDGMDWQAITLDDPAPPVPAGRSHAQLVWDSVRHSLVLTGGTNVTPTPQIWELSGTGPDAAVWTPVSTSDPVDEPDVLAPPERYDAMIAYDSLRSRVVLFGGVIGGHGSPAGATTSRNDTWERVDSGWRPVATMGRPTARHASAMTFDPTRGVVILFGGLNDSAAYLGDTWQFDGTTWTPLTSVTTPPPRAHAQMVFDEARQRVVMFGGSGSGTTKLGDTWVLDSTGWTQAVPSASPAGRSDAAMAYDPLRERVVMVSGDTQTQAATREVWEYDGTTWFDRTPTDLTNDPIFPGHVGLVYDRARRRCVLFLASDSDGALPDASMHIYEWDGTAWSTSSAPTTTQPESRNREALVYDDTAHAIVLFGGTDGFTEAGDTAMLGYQAREPAEACFTHAFDYDHDGKTGCADDECWAYCMPLCAPDTSSPVCPAPDCGDATCSSPETHRTCSADCP